ncbi:MAG: hypothetical protein HC895_26215, partial [Leptolyngbyaceae cyanobacterium SM1_3_5]|nr:hypothetical protein [Leptolyngbyaceae cyanobacterium SM1_3_5]
MTNPHDLRAVPLTSAEFVADPPIEPAAMPLRSQTDLAAPPDWVRLDWSQLAVFEAVDRQFLSCGVQFENAIALQPSNPAYPAAIGTTLLFAAPPKRLARRPAFPQPCA